MIFRFFTLLIALLSGCGLWAQEKWNLEKCVTYALEHNISVRQADLQTRFAALDFQQSKMARQPGANFSTNIGYSSGRNQDPTSFNLITQGYLTNGYSLQAGLDLFNWFTKKNNIAAKGFSLKAANAGLEKAKDDVALNVAVAYLQVLLNREQVNLTKAKIVQTKAQLESTRKQVDAGKLPELNAVNLESVLATDSSNLVTAETAAQKSLLVIKALLNLEADAGFDIETPPVAAIPIENLADLQPDAVYTLAVKSLPQQKADELNVKAAIKNAEVARGSMYPTISLFGSLGTTFNNRAREIKSIKTINAPLGTVSVNGTNYDVFPLQPFTSANYGGIGYADQLNQNFRQSIGLSISVPIANGGSLRTNWQRSKLNIKQAELQKEQNSFTLKQDIYNAYYDAVAAIQKYNANKRSVDAAEKAYDFATKRYEVGLLSTYDLITTQTTLQEAKTQALLAQYDYVFKMKLLEFYKGQGLKL